MGHGKEWGFSSEVSSWVDEAAQGYETAPGIGRNWCLSMPVFQSYAGVSTARQMLPRAFAKLAPDISLCELAKGG